VGRKQALYEIFDQIIGIAVRILSVFLRSPISYKDFSVASRTVVSK
jgi:hypothetical protein